jgi:hypothetical protein
MSNGVSKRKACHFVGITRRGLVLSLKDNGDGRMKESILAFWRPNMGYRMLLPCCSKSFLESIANGSIAFGGTYV